MTQEKAGVKQFLAGELGWYDIQVRAFGRFSKRWTMLDKEDFVLSNGDSVWIALGCQGGS